MALKVWLPLNGDLKNLGASNVVATNTGATISSPGKIGNNCYSFNGSSNWIKMQPVLFSNASTEFSVCCWFKTNSTTGAECLFSQRNAANSNGFSIFVYGTTGKVLIDDGVRWQITPKALTANTWYHLAFTRSQKGKAYYINGELVASTTTIGTPTTVGSTNFMALGTGHNSATAVANNWMNGYLNDYRIYDHCLSALEVKEISQSLILHYKLSAQSEIANDNLFLKTRMNASDRSGWVKNNSTDFTKLFRYYNGSAGIHSFSDAGDGSFEDTVSLNTTGNLGIAFLRANSELNLDPNSYYTLSCEAQCTSVNKSLSIGTSYYTTSNSWQWRGGANPVAFNAANTWQKFTLTFKPDNNIQYICYCFTVVGASNGTDKFTIRHCKLEKGSEATKWQPAPEELESNVSSNKIIDSSGYGNNGTASTALTVQRDNCRYGSSTLLDQKKITCSPCFPQIADPIFTVSLWFKLYSNITYTSYADLISIPATNSSQLFRLELCGSPAGANLEWFRGPTGTSGGFTVGSTTSGWYTLDEWHHTVLVGEGNKQYTCYFDGVQTNTYNGSANTWTPTGAISLGDTIQGTANFSDFRVYTTALSADDVATLYHTSAQVNNLGGVHGFEFVEAQSNISVTENGRVLENEINEIDFANNAQFMKETHDIIGNNFIEK